MMVAPRQPQSPPKHSLRDTKQRKSPSRGSTPKPLQLHVQNITPKSVIGMPPKKGQANASYFLQHVHPIYNGRAMLSEETGPNTTCRSYRPIFLRYRLCKKLGALTPRARMPTRESDRVPILHGHPYYNIQRKVDVNRRNRAEHQLSKLQSNLPEVSAVQEVGSGSCECSHTSPRI